MEPATYAVWVLVLQVVAYLSYLDFGLQTAIGRYVAFANEKNDPQWRDGIFSTAFAGLSIAGLLGACVLVCAVAALRHIFPSIPTALLPQMRIAVLVVGASVVLGLPSSAWNGVFVGLQRYEIPAITVGASRLLSALGLIVAATTRQSLVIMAIILAGTNLLSYFLQYGMLLRIAPEIHFRAGLITRTLARELSGYCLSLTVWSFSMLLVSGFDLILVGRFEFTAVTPYSVSATLITLLAGIQTAIFGVLMPRAASLQAQENAEALGSLLIRSTKIGVLILLLTGLPLIAFASVIIKVWIGGTYAIAGGRILVLLVIANMVRLTGTPYASILIGTGQQRSVVLSPFLEGITNIFASFLLGLKFGAIGVAWGTLLGAIVGVLANIFYNIPRTNECIRVSKREYLETSLFIPFLWTTPFFICRLFVSPAGTGSRGTILWATTLGLAMSACFLQIARTLLLLRRLRQ